MAIIQSYGLFWNVADTYWGQSGKTGTLLGKPARARSSDPIDFREQIGIYVLYDEYNMIYVGQAGVKDRRLFRRLRGHRKDHLANRWNKFSWFGLRGVLRNGTLSSEKKSTKSSRSDILDHVEAVLIAAAEPTLNKHGGRFGKKKGVLKYVQYRDERLGSTQDEMIKDLWGHIAS